MKKSRLLGSGCLRVPGLLGAVPLLLLSVAGAPAVAAGGAVSAAAPRAIPVAGVAAFGIGAGHLQGPDGVAVGASGAVFVADNSGDRVLEYIPGSPGYPRTGVTVAGGRGTGSGLGQLNGPTGVALDSKGDLFVSDSGNNRVLEYVYSAARHRYAPAGRVVAGTGVAGPGPSQLSSPTGLAIMATGNLVVADSGNNRVQEFSYDRAAGRFAARATTIAGTGGDGSGASQLSYPAGIALDARGDLFVADAGNFRVMEYAVTAATQAYPADGTVVISGQFCRWLALDSRGDLFVSWSYVAGGMVEIRYNPVTRSFASRGTPVGTAQENGINAGGLAFDTSGHLFVAYTAVTSNPDWTVWDLVLEFSYDPRAGTYSPVGTVMTQIGRQDEGVSAVAVDSHRNLFVSDVDGSVYEFRPAAAGYAPLGTVIAPPLAEPAVYGSALALDSRNDLFVASQDGPGVLEYRPDAAGRYPASGSPVPGASELTGLQVTAIAVDSRNDLLIGSGEQVLEFRYSAATGSYAPSGTVIATVAGSSPPTPAGLAVDAHGDLFVTSPAAGVVQEYLFNAKTGTYAPAGITVASVPGNSQGTYPTGIAVNGRGDLFVFTSHGNSVLEFTGNPATGIYAAESTVIFGGGGTGWPGTGGVGLDREGDLFFGNNVDSAVVYEVAASALR